MKSFCKISDSILNDSEVMGIVIDSGIKLKLLDYHPNSEVTIFEVDSHHNGEVCLTIDYEKRTAQIQKYI